MYKVKLTAKARRELKDLSKQHKITLYLVFEELKENPAQGKVLGRKLSGRHSLRAGVFRVIYKVNKKDRVVTIMTAGHRSNVYQ